MYVENEVSQESELKSRGGLNLDLREIVREMIISFLFNIFIKSHKGFIIQKERKQIYKNYINLHKIVPFSFYSFMFFFLSNLFRALVVSYSELSPQVSEIYNGLQILKIFLLLLVLEP